MKVTNTAKGMRGLHTLSGLVMLDPNETRDDLQISAAELASAKSTGYFEFDGKAATTDDGDADSNLDDNSVAELEKIATDEGVDVSAITGTGANGRVLKADIVAAIEAKRAGGARAGDELDGMSDDDLRATVQAVTGAEPAGDATREQLLGLARGTGQE